MRGIRLGLATFVAVAIAGVASLSGTAQAAYPQTSFRLEYGATISTGTITWYNRSAAIEGNLKAYSGCKAVTFTAVNDREYDNGESPLICRNGSSVNYGDTLNIDVAGGPSVIYVYLTAGNPQVERPDIVDKKKCTRSGCVSF